MSKYLRITVDAVAVTERGEHLVNKLIAEHSQFVDEKLGRRLQAAIENGDIEIDGVSDAEDHGG